MSILTSVKRFLDLMTDPMFQRDEQGRELFFPMGLGSKGRIVPDNDTSARIRKALNRGWAVLFLAIVPLFTGLTLFVSSGWIFLGLLLLLLMAQFAFTSYLARGLEVSSRRMTLSNQTASVADRYGMGYISLNIVLSIALTLASALIFVWPSLAKDLPGWYSMLLAFGTVFFAAITGMWVRIALLKRRLAH